MGAVDLTHQCCDQLCSHEVKCLQCLDAEQGTVSNAVQSDDCDMLFFCRSLNPPNVHDNRTCNEGVSNFRCLSERVERLRSFHFFTATEN